MCVFFLLKVELSLVKSRLTILKVTTLYSCIFYGVPKKVPQKQFRCRTTKLQIFVKIPFHLNFLEPQENVLIFKIHVQLLTHNVSRNAFNVAQTIPFPTSITLTPCFGIQWLVSLKNSKCHKKWHKISEFLIFEPHRALKTKRRRE